MNDSASMQAVTLHVRRAWGSTTPTDRVRCERPDHRIPSLLRLGKGREVDGGECMPLHTIQLDNAIAMQHFSTSSCTSWRSLSTCTYIELYRTVLVGFLLQIYSTRRVAFPEQIEFFRNDHYFCNFPHDGARACLAQRCSIRQQG